MGVGRRLGKMGVSGRNPEGEMKDASFACLGSTALAGDARTVTEGGWAAPTQRSKAAPEGPELNTSVLQGQKSLRTPSAS